MSAATKHSDHHEPREFVVTTFSSKPKVRSPSRDILWSEVWDAESPMTLGHPFRWVLQATGEKLRIRDLGKESDRIVTHPVDDIPFEELSKHGAIELGEGKRKFW